MKDSGAVQDAESMQSLRSEATENQDSFLGASDYEVNSLKINRLIS
jgi:hypothetical protein